VNNPVLISVEFLRFPELPLVQLLTFIPHAVVLFGSTITGSDKRIMLSDVRQRRLWGYGTMARKEEASSTVISVHGLSGSTRMNFEFKVSWDSTPYRAVAADVSMNHSNCPVETVKCVTSLECAASRLGATRIWRSYSMIGDHALMIHYEEQNEQVLIQTCKFIVL
jgi:hypothetical protein